MDDYIQDSAPYLEPDSNGLIQLDGSEWKIVPVDAPEDVRCARCHLSSVYGVLEAGRKFCPVVPCRKTENQLGTNSYLVIWKALA